MSLTSEVQNVLECLISDPSRPQLRSQDIPASLSREARRYVVNMVQNHPDAVDSSVVQCLAQPYALVHELQGFYAALVNLGVEDGDIQRNLVLWFLATDVLRVPEHLVSEDLGPLTDSDKIIVDAALRRRRNWLLEDYALFYAVENHLCYHEPDGWRLTGLGRALLRLSVLQGTRFLLSLEVFLNAGEADEWHMSESFLQHVLQEERMILGAYHRHGDEGPAFATIIWNEYLDRLLEFDLAKRSPHKRGTAVAPTNLGRLMIKSVLDRDSALDSLVPIYIRGEMIGAEPPDFASQESVERIRRLLDGSQLVGELKEPILHEVERLSQADAPFLSVFKALAPCVEGILRNLTRVENLKVEDYNLRGYIKAIDKARPPVLKLGTLQMTDAALRPYRNVVEHGYMITAELARMLCEISLLVIEQIHADYVAFKEAMQE